MLNELDNLAKEVSRSVEGAAYFLLAAHNEMQEERENLREGLLNRKKPELESFENSSPL